MHRDTPIIRKVLGAVPKGRTGRRTGDTVAIGPFDATVGDRQCELRLIPVPMLRGRTRMSTATYDTQRNGRVYRDAMPSPGRSMPIEQRVATRDLVSRVGIVMNRNLAAVTQDLLDRLVSEVGEIAGDDRLVQLMGASIEANVDTIVHILGNGIDIENTVAPSAAVEYARRVAQRGLPVNALVRCYRLGQERFLRWCLEELQRQSDDALAVSEAALLIVSDTSAYIDRVSQHVVEVYEGERDRWLLNRNASRSARVTELLERRPVDLGATETMLGYRLRQQHVGLVVWADRKDSDEPKLAALERAVGALADKLGCGAAPLFVPCDESSAWAWLPLGSETTVDGTAVADFVAAEDKPIHVAVGVVQQDAEGFARTHEQAKHAQTVALATQRSGPSATFFSEVGALALLCSSLEATKAWVADTLGALAADDEPRARLRETVRVFLAAGGSYTAAADQLNLHRNSVVYRLHKAEEELGRPLREGRLQLELALDVCHWFGKVVLLPAAHAH